ncbi:MAG: 50S ribosomal protein L17 [Clostridia bacterium]|nr:50S ribosomal protein L17 [Clostridia bacterium]
MSTKKLGKPTDQRVALVTNLATDLLWHGRIETTLDRAKEASKLAEKCITIAKKGYADVVTEEKTSTDSKGKEKKVKVSKDGAVKLNCRRKLLALLDDRQEQKTKGEKKEAFEARTNGIKHPLIEKLFDDYAPKYADRNGGYTRILKTEIRRGDNAQLAIVELV